MKTTILLLTALALIGPSFAVDKAQPAARTPAESSKVIAYYFHSAQRCPTCRKIETFSAESIKKGFAEDLKNGSIEWRVVNIDESANRHFVKDFGLYASSLVLVSQEKGKPPRWKNLDRVWQLVGKPDAFQQYVQDELREFVKGS